MVAFITLVVGSASPTPTPCHHLPSDRERDDMQSQDCKTVLAASGIFRNLPRMSGGILFLRLGGNPGIVGNVVITNHLGL